MSPGRQPAWQASPAPRVAWQLVPDRSPALADVQLSLVAPVHNEAECIDRFVAEAWRALRELARPFELILVDDGSTDGTASRLPLLQGTMPELRVIRLSRRMGQSAALAAGIRAARGRLVALTDADLQNDPSDIARMLAMLESNPGVDAVVGWRSHRQDSWLRRQSSRLANRISGWLTGDHSHDAGCGLKLVRAERIRAVPSFAGMHRFFTPLIEMGGGRVIEMVVHHRPRPAGVSKYGRGLGRTFTALYDAIGVRWLRSRYLAIEGAAVELDRPEADDRAG